MLKIGLSIKARELEVLNELLKIISLQQELIKNEEWHKFFNTMVTRKKKFEKIKNLNNEYKFFIETQEFHGENGMKLIQNEINQKNEKIIEIDQENIGKLKAKHIINQNNFKKVRLEKKVNLQYNTQKKEGNKNGVFIDSFK